MIHDLYTLYSHLLRRQNEHGLTESELVTLAYLLEILYVAGRPSILMPLEDVADGLGLKKETLRDHLRRIDRRVGWIRLVLSGTHVVIHLWCDDIAESGTPAVETAGRDEATVESAADASLSVSSGDGENREKSGKIGIFPDASAGGGGGEGDFRGKTGIFGEKSGFLRKNGDFWRPIITGRTVGKVLHFGMFNLSDVGRDNRPTAVYGGGGVGEGGVRRRKSPKIAENPGKSPEIARNRQKSPAKAILEGSSVPEGVPTEDLKALEEVLGELGISPTDVRRLTRVAHRGGIPPEEIAVEVAAHALDAIRDRGIDSLYAVLEFRLGHGMRAAKKWRQQARERLHGRGEASYLKYLEDPYWRRLARRREGGV